MHASLCAFSIVSVLCPWYLKVLPPSLPALGIVLHSDPIQRHEPLSLSDPIICILKTGNGRGIKKRPFR
ncbi:hypothetical protein CORC01_11243 [Colletotrichum orchidophilum]|uniref:Secreted protein n=1 Tax=Colletotrichum orchidophilum TaxID=1209926 RepID=A0A1G4AWC5_9PEZI|nr:uncharacterized protein CORC01_11243 [Colletotrichum orchidophilum]OHE93468.1 hypothetical protein CORC01_11243 [Colletotrichum orchidophilum]